jgi:hypothetical protein
MIILLHCLGDYMVLIIKNIYIVRNMIKIINKFKYNFSV